MSRNKETRRRGRVLALTLASDAGKTPWRARLRYPFWKVTQHLSLLNLRNDRRLQISPIYPQSAFPTDTCSQRGSGEGSDVINSGGLPAAGPAGGTGSELELVTARALHFW